MEAISLSSFNGSTFFSSSVPDVEIPLTNGSVKAFVSLSIGRIDEISQSNGSTVTIGEFEDATRLFGETFWPVNNVITIQDLCSIVEPYVQKILAVRMKITVQPKDGSDTNVGDAINSTATILFSRADVGISADEFYNNYFLSILMGPRTTAHGRREFLWYYGNDSATVTALYEDGSAESFDAVVSGSTSVYTQLDVSPHYYEQLDKQLVAYTVIAGNRQQRFEMDLSEPDCAPILEFYNSFGVWELLYCTGTHKVSPEYKRSSARFGSMLRNYQIRETRTFHADTGVMSTAMANWADDLFRSDDVYVVNVVDGEVVDRERGKKVIITESKSERTNDDDHLPRFTFSYQYAQRVHNVLQLNRVGRIFDNTFDNTFN